jgi:preprotein translocase subunit SecE
MKFFKEVRAELAKVEWPKRPEVFKMTGLVILISLAVALYIGILDIVIAKVVEAIVK